MLSSWRNDFKKLQRRISNYRLLSRGGSTSSTEDGPREKIENTRLIPSRKRRTYSTTRGHRGAPSRVLKTSLYSAKLEFFSKTTLSPHPSLSFFSLFVTPRVQSDYFALYLRDWNSADHDPSMSVSAHYTRRAWDRNVWFARDRTRRSWKTN